MATFDEQSDLVVNEIQDRSAQADGLLAQTQTAIDDTRAALDTAIAALTANGISINVSGVDTTYVAPTAAAPTVPDGPGTIPTVPTADSIAISQALWDAAFTRAQGLQDRIGVKNIALANNRAAWLGHAEWDETQAAALAEAQDKDDAETSKNALASAVEEAKALREDVIALAPLSTNVYAVTWKVALDLYQAAWANKTASEQSRLGFERLELDKSVDPERVRAEYDLKKTEMAMTNAVGQLGDLAQILAQVTASLVSGSDVNLSSSVGMSLGQIKYNPSEGEVVQSPA